MGLWCSASALSVAEDPIALLVAVIERNEGRLARAAWDLGIGRRKLYAKVNEWGLWPTVNAARAARRARRKGAA